MSIEQSFSIHLARAPRGRVELREGKRAVTPATTETPARVARLLALAHKIEGLVASGEVKDYAEVAFVGGGHAGADEPDRRDAVPGPGHSGTGPRDATPVEGP